MSVSLVKVNSATHVFTAGWNMPGYLPDSDSGPAVFATLDAAREYLADEITRAAEFLADGDTDEDDSSWDDVASMEASAEYVKADPDGDIAHGTRLLGGTFGTFENDGLCYWIARNSLGMVFGGDDSSDEYLDVVDALQS